MKRAQTQYKQGEQTPERLDDAIFKVIEWIAAENVSLALIDDYLSPKPASLSSSPAQSAELEKRMSRIVQRFGGPAALSNPVQ